MTPIFPAKTGDTVAAKEIFTARSVGPVHLKLKHQTTVLRHEFSFF